MLQPVYRAMSVHDKEPRGCRNFRSHHYGLSHNQIAVLGRKTLGINQSISLAPTNAQGNGSAKGPTLAQ